MNMAGLLAHFETSVWSEPYARRRAAWQPMGYARTDRDAGLYGAALRRK